MANDRFSFDAARRNVLKLLCGGLTAPAVATLALTDTVFAKQFVDEGPVINLPKMVYDPELQMMVDPTTRAPIYQDAKGMTIASGLSTVTSGCGNCPKKDDAGS
jgi:hypothetical protein